MCTNRDISLTRRGRLYSSCVWSSMLHGSETWPVRKENEVALQRAEMRMVRWMCNVKVKDRVPSKELREGLGIDEMILLLQQNRLQSYGHVLWKEDMTLTGWRNVLWNMRRRAPHQEVDQTGHGTNTQPFYGPFYRTTRVSRCQKITSGLYGAREDQQKQTHWPAFLS